LVLMAWKKLTLDIEAALQAILKMAAAIVHLKVIMGEVRSVYAPLGTSNGVKRTVDCGWVTEWAMGVFANDSLTKGAKIGTPYYDAEVYTRKGDDFESIGRLGNLTEKQKSGISEFRGCGSYEFPDAEGGRRRGSLIANPGALEHFKNIAELEIE